MKVFIFYLGDHYGPPIATETAEVNEGINFLFGWTLWTHMTIYEDCQDISRNWFLFFGWSLRTLITTKTAKVNEGIYIVLGWYLWTLIATKTDKVNKGIYILFGWYLWTLSFTKTAKGLWRYLFFGWSWWTLTISKTAKINEDINFIIQIDIWDPYHYLKGHYLPKS